MSDPSSAQLPHVVIIGGGFGGLYAARSLKRAPVRVTLIDRRNYHLFQPLLYQVATGGLSPSDIASPLRAVLSRQRNVRVLQAEAVDIVPDEKRVILRDGAIDYDVLILSTGVTHHYFGHDEWESVAPGLKEIEDALYIRRRVLLAFEAAEREPDPERRRVWQTFVVVGGGPTGVELAGALAELAHKTLKHDFRHIDPAQTRVILLEGIDRVLPPYPPDLSAKAADSLEHLGVTVRTNTMVTDIDEGVVTVKHNDQEERIRAQTVLWAAGVKASPLGKILAEKTGAELDRAGRVRVSPDCSVPGYPDLFVIGDLAHFAHNTEQPLPGVAQVAIQQGQYVAKLIAARQAGRAIEPFRYFDKGNLAVIGRNSAVADLGRFHFGGFFAWLIWVFIHILYLIEHENRLLVMIQWAWSYFTKNRGARLITGDDPFPLVDPEAEEMPLPVGESQ